MGSGVDDDAVRAVAKDVVRQLAPGELIAYEALSGAYFADPDRALRGDSGGDPLRFGDAAVALLLTPVVLAVTTEVTRYLCTEVLAPELVRRGSSALADALRRLLRRDTADAAPAQPDVAGPEPVPPLTPAQRERVRRIVAETTRRAGAPDQLALLIADSVVGAELNDEQPR